MSDADKTTGPLWLLIGLQAAISAGGLVVEIVAGRMIAPYVGMSLYTWTAIIAVVLTGFSVGHWWGGRLAAWESARALRATGWIMAMAALVTALASLVLRWTATPVLLNVTDPLLAIWALTTLAFFLPSLFAGVPSPVLAVVAMRGATQSERVLGAMFAAGAVGAILGTLLAGFVFISWVGSVGTLLVMALVYAISAVLCFYLGGLAGSARWSAAVALALPVAAGGWALTSPKVCDDESSYYCIRTVALTDGPRPVNLMVLDHLAHGISARDTPRIMHTDHTAMLDALPRMRMGRDDFSSFHIGGGSYSVPRAWADRAVSEIVVSEVDPAVTQAAVRDFWFDPGSAEVMHRDGRAALRESPRKFDVIVGDAFTDIAVPAHLVTTEFFSLVADRLTPGGVFAMNAIDYVDRMEALAALVVTLQEVFHSVEVWTEALPPQPGERRVFVLLAGSARSPVSQIETLAPDPKRFAVLDPAYVEQVIDRLEAQPLTDDFAPIDRLVGLAPLLQ
ncbi:fused MFS/spermidine synthase [Jannaschia seohaensis]|uniref:Spermine/spermidine synthase n=1 Tax=Jannaschia seohaensis TaxID=475081 RepID=A0A2Y9B338_9RHOB|nr:fused MFS/spermidine synthase [Jannaschia seohaensis]PWJ13872.1 spermine/spermidine synthase [Jannaschia seohaensis]SSA50385.1 Spermine/spermidine synthase [Jannaschia seohaensis]